MWFTGYIDSKKQPIRVGQKVYIAGYRALEVVFQPDFGLVLTDIANNMSERLTKSLAASVTVL